MNALKKLDREKLKPEHDSLLVKRIIIAHTKMAINTLDSELKQFDGVTNILKRRNITGKLIELKKFLDLTTKPENTKDDLLKLVSGLDKNEKIDRKLQAKIGEDLFPPVPLALSRPRHNATEHRS